MLPKKSNTDFYIYMTIIASIMAVFISLHFGVIRTELLATGDYPNDVAPILEVMQQGSEHMMSHPFGFMPLKSEYFHYTPMILGIVCIALFLLYVDEKRNEHAKADKAQGSAKWNTNMKKYNKKYTDPPKSPKNDGPRNMILSKNVSLSMNTKQTFLNDCVLIVGGSGSGKTRYEIKPNLLQANCSYVITDPSGELLASCGSFLEQQGYEIKVFNLVEMNHSNCYNPFEYIRDEQGVITLVNCLIQNTNNGKSGGDPFWEKSETALLTALILYLKYHRGKEDQNFSSVMKLLRIATVDENNPNAQSKLDQIFEVIGRKNPNDIAYKNYMTFKMGAGKTLKSILISCAVRLNAFNLETIENLTCKDDLDLKSLGDRKQALFVIIPAADDTFNYLVSMMYSQLFETLYYHAEVECPSGYYINNSDGTVNCFQPTKEDAETFIAEHPGCTMSHGSNHVAHHVRFLLDEFANIGQIPAFEKKLATMRKYELSCTIILQNLAQLKNLYKDSNEDIIGNCDTFIFLGGKSYDTLEYLSKMLGKTTIKIRNNSRSQGKSGSTSLSFNTTGRELLNPNEISLIDGTHCIVLIRGVDPFFDEKYDYTSHPNYQYTGDADSKLLYSVTIDNTKKLSADDLEKMSDEEKQKISEHEPIGETKNIKQFVEDEKITTNNAKKRFTAEQSDENKDVIVTRTTEKELSREQKNKSVMDTLKNGPNKKSFSSNVNIPHQNKEQNTEKTIEDQLGDEIFADKSKDMSGDGNTYDGTYIHGPQPDFSEQRKNSYEAIAEMEKQYKNRRPQKTQNGTKQKKETHKTSVETPKNKKEISIHSDTEKKVDTVTPDVVEPDFEESSNNATEQYDQFFDPTSFL